MHSHPLAGVYAAALTPLTPEFEPDLAALPQLLNFLAMRGCHGALLLGTTGEGPSFSLRERQSIFEAALGVRETHPQFRLLGGTGTPSLDDTIQITREAFAIGLDGVVVLPPYYYRDATIEGLFAWFEQVIRAAVPLDGALFGYHIPKVSGVPLEIDLLDRLFTTFPRQFVGVKDSSGDPVLARELGDRFGAQGVILTGNDRLLTHALEAGGSGCITAAANLLSPYLRRVWDAIQDGQPDAVAQAHLDDARAVLEHFAPFPPTLKTLIARSFDFPLWPVRAPLVPLTPEQEYRLFGELNTAGIAF